MLRERRQAPQKHEVLISPSTSRKSGLLTCIEKTIPWVSPVVLTLGLTSLAVSARRKREGSPNSSGEGENRPNPEYVTDLKNRLAELRKTMNEEQATKALLQQLMERKDNLDPTELLSNILSAGKEQKSSSFYDDTSEAYDKWLLENFPQDE